jgi:hypothetical protein
MRRSGITAALMVCAAALALAPEPRAQEEPSLFEEKPAATPTPAPEAPQAPATPAAPAALPAPPPRVPVPMKPLSARLDFARWQSMSERERQTFVEGAVTALTSLTERLRVEVGGDSRADPAKMLNLVRFINENQPRHSADAYLREMSTLYTTAEGQALSMSDCFLRGFRRINGR